MDHVPHSIYIKPLLARDVWPENPNFPIGSTGGWGYLPVHEINTYDDWKIVPTSRPVVAPPAKKENEIELTGTYGSLDFSRAHTGLPIYGNRKGSWEFVVLNDFRSWEVAYSDIQHSVHGRRCLVTLEDDRDYYYAGTLTLNEWRSDPGWSRIVINYNLEPFKYSKKKTEISFDLSRNEPYSTQLKSTALGRAPVHPWIKCTPSTDGNFKIDCVFGNTELAMINYITLSHKNIYKQIPEMLLSNENGNNTIQLADFTFSPETDASIETIHVDILYTRRYM